MSQAAKDVAKEAAKKAVAAQAESKQKKNKSVPSKAERVDLSKSAKAEAAVKKPDHGLALHVASSPGSAACKAQAPHSQRARPQPSIGASGATARALVSPS